MTDDQLIKALGGGAEVARLLRIKPPSVSGWTHIPRDRKIRLAVIAEDRKICKRQDVFPHDYHEIWPELRNQ